MAKRKTKRKTTRRSSRRGLGEVKGMKTIPFAKLNKALDHTLKAFAQGECREGIDRAIEFGTQALSAERLTPAQARTLDTKLENISVRSEKGCRIAERSDIYAAEDFE